MSTVHHRAVDAVRREEAHRRRSQTVEVEEIQPDIGQPTREVSYERRVRMVGRGHVGHIDPLVRSAAVDEIAAQGLPAVEAVARHAAVAHEGQRLRGDHLDAGRGEGKENAEHVREESRLRPRRDDHGVGPE